MYVIYLYIYTHTYKYLGITYDPILQLIIYIIVIIEGNNKYINMYCYI